MQTVSISTLGYEFVDFGAKAAAVLKEEMTDDSSIEFGNSLLELAKNLAEMNKAFTTYVNLKQVNAGDKVASFKRSLPPEMPPTAKRFKAHGCSSDSGQENRVKVWQQQLEERDSRSTSSSVTYSSASDDDSGTVRKSTTRPRKRKARKTPTSASATVQENEAGEGESDAIENDDYVMADLAVSQCNCGIPRVEKLLFMVELASENKTEDDLRDQIKEQAIASLMRYRDMVVIGLTKDGYIITTGNRIDSSTDGSSAKHSGDLENLVKIKQSPYFRYDGDDENVFSSLVILMTTLMTRKKNHSLPPGIRQPQGVKLC